MGGRKKMAQLHKVSRLVSLHSWLALAPTRILELGQSRVPGVLEFRVSGLGLGFRV